MNKEYNEIDLKKQANIIRQDVIKMLAKAGSGHPAGALGSADIMTALYFNILNHDAKKPFWDKRDRLILSNGHEVPVRYAALARAGYFPVAKLKTLRKFGSPLQGHPSLIDFPLMECSSGPLGQGISVAVGMALAAKHHLNNLTVIVDRNNIQIDGKTDEVLPLEPLKDKLKAFGFQALTIDGHSFKQIIKACEKAKTNNQKPTAIIAKTIPGKGVSFIEGKHEWHGKAPKPEEAEKALEELNKELESL